jgi:hypothetical protein
MRRRSTVSTRAAVVVSLVLVLAVLALPGLPGPVAPTPAAAQATGQVVTDRVAYGPNEAVYASGNVTFFQGCKTRPGRTGLGVDDIFQPWADLYVVPHGSTGAVGGLRDVSGSPNVIFGGLAGGFVEEVIGYTGPSGTIPAGVYDVVVDECQDGLLDPEDAVMSEAFRVTVPLGTAPAVVGGPDKGRAAALAGDYAALAKVWDALLTAVSKKQVGGVSLSFASDVSVGLFQVLTQTALPDPRPAAGAALVQMGRRQKGIAADPPDANFQAHGTLDAGPPIGPGITGDPLEDAVLAAARAQAVDSALLGALVTAVERHQGAAEVGNGDWMAAHARDALELLAVIEARASVSPDGFRAVGDAYVDQIFDIRTHVDQLLNRPKYYLNEGDGYQDERTGRNRGLSQAEIDAAMAELGSLEPARPVFGNLGGTGLRTNLDAVADDLEAQALGFGDLRASLEASLVSLADEGRDGPRPVAAAGGPYAGTLGEPLVLDATGSTGSAAVVEWAWDLDLDGTFDDATGPSPTFVPDQPGTRVVAVQVTDEIGATDRALAVVDVTVGDLPPVLTSVSPMPAVVEGAPAAPFELSVAAEDPEGQAVTIEWRHDGDVVGTGGTLTGVAPSPWGTDRYDAVAADPGGNLVAQTFFVTGWGPDEDGDGWRLPGDCDDTDPQVRPDIYPGETTGNGIDDDCDPTTPDEAQAPRITSAPLDIDKGPAHGVQEGDLVTLDPSWSHPGRYSGQEFTWTADWGDGTITSGTVSGRNYAETQFAPEHVYRSDGRKSATVCITGPEGLEACVTNRDLVYRTPFLPAPPVVHPADLEDWTSYDVGRPGEWGVNIGVAESRWFIAPGGFSGMQETNRTFPNVLVSDYELDVDETGSARVAFDLGTIGYDDDTIGFTLGLAPGEAEQDDADWLAVTMYGHDEISHAGLCGGSGADVATTVEHPNQLLRFRGYPHYTELSGSTLDIPDATDPLCRDDMGSEVLDGADLPVPLGRPDTGVWKNLVHPAELVVPTAQIDRLYHAEVEYSPEEITVWIDGVELLHAVAPPDDPFPLGHVGLLSQSQPDTRLIGHTQAPVERATQGETRAYSAVFADADLDASHEAVVDWADGRPASTASIEPVPGRPGFWTAAAEHAYATVGVHHAEVCVTDTEDLLVGCGTIVVVVDNAPPVVSAGADATTVGPMALAGATYTDPGWADTHTATVDWGDGSPVEPAAIEGRPGSGVLSGDHVYDTPGSYTATVCVTDAPALGPDPRPGDGDGLTGCDELEVEVLGPATPVAVVAEDVTGVEGTATEVAVGFTDGAPGQTHTVSIDWGDGEVDDDVVIVDRGRAGIGRPTHDWADDGTYEVTATVCVTGDVDRCDVATTEVEVANAAPVVDEPIDLSVLDGEHRLTAAFTDPGIEDTHTATVDWGAGAGPVPAAVDPLPGGGGGTVSAAHRYATSGSAVVTVCVADDGAATGCATVEAEATAVPGPPLDVAAIGGDAEARVRWEAPLDDGGAPIEGYEVETTPGPTTVGVTAPDLTTVVTGLINGVDHTFRVRAANEHGWGPWSEPSNVTRPRASCTGAAFADVGPTHPFCPEITWMADEGISGGYADGRYQPAVPTTRQAMAAFLYRLAGAERGPDPACPSAPFADVPVGHAFCGEIAWMADIGITDGFDDGTFRPGVPMSRQAMAAFLHRATGSPEGANPTCGTDEFPDVPATHRFCGVIEWMVHAGVTGGYEDGTFRPAAQVSRQAMAAFVFRYAILTG